MSTAKPIDNNEQGIVLSGFAKDIIYSDPYELPCRTLNEDTKDEQFQVRLNGIWFDAQTIDFK